MLMTLPFWKYQISALYVHINNMAYHQVISRLNPIVASTATILHVSQQSTLPTVEPVGPVDGATSNIKDRALQNQKKLAFMSWILNIGKYEL